MVLVGLVIAWRFAGSPTLRSPLSTNATTDGVVRLPSLLAITTGSLPSITATHEFVVPKSIPIILDICMIVFLYSNLLSILYQQAMCQYDFGRNLLYSFPKSGIFSQK